MMIVIALPLVLCGRSGADHAHVTHEYVEELWELIEAGFADELTDAGSMLAVRQDPVADDARVEIEFEHETAVDTVLGHVVLLALLSVRVHAADLIESELVSVPAYTGLSEYDGTR